MLSRAERGVVNYLVQGKTNKEIADLLCVCEKTVKFHLTNIYAKEDVKSRSEMISKHSGNLIKYDETENYRSEVMDNIPSGQRPLNPNAISNTPMGQGARQVQVVGKSQEDKITFIDEKFRVGETIAQLHSMMKDVVRSELTPNTVNAACNCVARLNETITTAIQAAKFLNER